MNPMDRNRNVFTDNRNIPLPIVVPDVIKENEIEIEIENKDIGKVVECHLDKVIENIEQENKNMFDFNYDKIKPPILQRNTNTFPEISTDKREYGEYYKEDNEIVSIFMKYNGSRSIPRYDNNSTKADIIQLLADQNNIVDDGEEKILCSSLEELNLNSCSSQETDVNSNENYYEAALSKELEPGKDESPQNFKLLDDVDCNEDISTSASIDVDIQESGDETIKQDKEDSHEKLNMYNNTQYNTCQQKAKEFEESAVGYFYKTHFCLKPCLSSKCREATIQKYFAEIKDHVSNTYEEVLAYNQMRLCVLHKDHEGPCSSTPFSEKKMLVKSRVSNKMETSINSCIYQVPGDTSGNSIYKNRASRLYPIVIGSNTKIKIQRQSSDSKVPKICISLKEHTTPFQMATAYIDWVTYALHIDGMEENILSPLSEPFLSWKNGLQTHHATFLQNYFKERNRKIFDVSTGVRRTICAVKQNVLTVANFADTTRDNRIDIDPNDVQMGHIVPRSNNEYTIRGTNLLMMTREGNRAVGENDYMDNSWILKDISILQNLCNPKLE